MTLENCNDHVNTGEAAVLARFTSGAFGQLVTMALSIRHTLFLRIRWLWVLCSFLCFWVWRGWHRPSNCTAISGADLKQFAHGSLLGLEQFNCPFQPFKS